MATSTTISPETIWEKYSNLGYVPTYTLNGIETTLDPWDLPESYNGDFFADFYAWKDAGLIRDEFAKWLAWQSEQWLAWVENHKAKIAADKANMPKSSPAPMREWEEEDWEHLIENSKYDE